MLLHFPHAAWDQARTAEYEQARAKANQVLRTPDRRALIEQAYRELRGKAPTAEQVEAFVSGKYDTTPRELVDNLIAEEYGIYEVRNQVVLDYHTQELPSVPTGLFRNAFDPSLVRTTAAGDDAGAILVIVRCESGGQYLGAAKYDFYILDSERYFWTNFFKGQQGSGCGSVSS